MSATVASNGTHAPDVTARPNMIDVRNPISGALVGSVPNSTADDLRAAVARARAAQPAWAALSVQTRATMLRVWTAAMWARRDALIELIRAETGKNHTGAWIEIANMELLGVYYHRNSAPVLRPQTRRAPVPLVQWTRVYYQPYGVVGALTPWNYPLYNAFCDILPALIAGNTVVMKPSELTPLTALKAAEMLYDAGVPRDVLIVVTGDGATGAALVDEVDYVTLTGSSATGRKVAKRCGERLIPYTLELGGKDPLIVLDDANVELAASGTLSGALENAGQMCISTKRVYVTAGIYDLYLERVQHYAAQLRIGHQDDWETHIGSLTAEREVARVEDHVADAISKGATLIYGGKRRPDLGPLFYEPAILTNVTHEMRIMREETFGPVIPIVKVRDADEAIRMANDSEYGLSSSIYTGDLANGERLALKIASGDVNINRSQMVAAAHDLPWGGYKQSGIGRRGGPEGLLRFVQTHSVLVDSTIGSLPGLTLVNFSVKAMVYVMRVLRDWLPWI
jgi:succinate-semialdehyde dehydrogenase / glutarate-semialdehyde dehydrogenase